MGEDIFAEAIALLIFAAALALPLLVSRQARLLPSEHAILLTSTMVRTILCLLSASGLFLPPTSDSLDFHLEASSMALGAQPIDFSRPGAQIFTGAQSFFYSAFGSSILLADALGVLAFTASGIAFVAVARRVIGQRAVPLALALFCFAPAGLLYANFNYREPFQILSLMLAILHALRFRASDRLYDLAATAAFLFLFASVHAKFFVLAPIVIALAIFIPTENSRSLRRLPGFLIALLGTITFAFWMNLSLGENEVVRAVSQGSVTEYISEIGTSAVSSAARTTMPYFPKGETGIDLLTLSPFLLLQYTFAPLFPWLVTEPQDLVALTDTLLRILAIAGCAVAYLRGNGAERRTIAFLVLLYVAMSFVACLGTWTVGTAMRHQIKASWLLLIIASPVLSRWLGFFVNHKARRNNLAELGRALRHHGR